MSGADPFGHLGHCQRLGREGGEEGPWLQGGQEHVGQENDRGLSLCPGGSLPVIVSLLGPRPRPAAGYRDRSTWRKNAVNVEYSRSQD